MRVCVLFSFIWEGFVCPFPRSLGWRTATVPLPVLLCFQKRLPWSCSFSGLWLSGVPHSFNYFLLLWHQWYFIFLTFCSLSAFPLPIFICVYILPDRHLDPARNVPSGPVCASCPCFPLVAYSFHANFLLFLLLGEYFWNTHAVAIKGVAIF